MIILTIIVIITILGVLIFVHELGHFVMAKRAGMKVEEFGFGFPPRIFGIKKGETIYSLNWIPLGGFVKITGENNEESADPRAFSNKGFWPRLSVLIAGVSMNLIFAWFLLFIGLWLIGTPADVTDNSADIARASYVTEAKISIAAVSPASPASEAGFKTGDVILTIDGQEFSTIEDMVAYSSGKIGSVITYSLLRGKDVVVREVVPRSEHPDDEGPVGFIPAKIATIRFGLIDALRFSFNTFLIRFWAILVGFTMLLKTVFSGGGLTEGFSGPVGIAVITRDFTRLGIEYLVQFTAILSINLAILNGFPFPALDGGRVLFLLIEKIRGVKSIKWEQIANVVGFFLLIALMVFITFRDVAKFSDQFKNLFHRFL